MKEFRLTKQQKLKLSRNKNWQTRIESERRDRIRADHLRWCKQKAFEDLKNPDCTRFSAYSSFIRNMRMKLEMSGYEIILIEGLRLVNSGKLRTNKDVEQFIVEFN